MMKKENPRNEMRHKLFVKWNEMAISYHARAEMTECMADKPDEEKERLAVLLMEIIENSTTEEEMIARSRML